MEQPLSFGSTRERLRRHLFVIATIVFLVGSLGDVVTTYVGITRFGLAESTPFVISAIEQFGLLAGLVSTKLLAVGVVVLVAIPFRRYRDCAASLMLGILGLGYGYAAVHNIQLIF